MHEQSASPLRRHDNVPACLFTVADMGHGMWWACAKTEQKQERAGDEGAHG